MVCDGTSAVKCDETGQDPTSIACTVGLGACKRDGHLTCDSVCDAEVVTGTTERCDNQIDDDCDGDVNEGFPDLGADCDSNTTDTDLCKNDRIECLGTTTGCVEKVAFQAELCDGKDNDCDGLADETFLGGAFKLGEPCDGGDSDLCVEGVWVCSGDKAGTVCSDQTGSTVELCNGKDDDCDGSVDEDFTDLGASCDSDPEDGDSCANDVVRCKADGSGTLCAEVIPEQEETCNGEDDDCNEGIDENLFYGSCGAGTGICAQDGALTCIEAQIVCSVEGGSPKAADECGNALDDDCDGATDEGFERLGEPCDADDSNATLAVDTDLCKNDVWVCDPDDNTTLACAPVVFAVEACNGRDDDCDGEADETFTYQGLPLGSACDGGDDGTCKRGIVVCDGTSAVRCNETGQDPTSIACTVGLGACKRDGYLTCDSVCDAEVVTGTTERCDNQIDDDCDGDVNEGFPDLGVDCDSNTTDTDLCKNDRIECLGTTTGCVEKVAFQAERCDGKDNDCDGLADETFLGGTFKLGEPCDGGDSDLCVEGVWVCSGDKAGTVCSDQTGSTVELCNGKDDDCDGSVDEDFTDLGASCDSDPADGDSCANDVVRCKADGSATVCAEVIPAREEICNGADDDCNEGIDENLFYGSCGAGTGICAQSGVLTCIDAEIGCSVSGGSPKAADECGNALDDDCDGATDEGFERLGEPCDADDSNATIAVDTDLCKNDVWVCDPDDNTTLACAPVVFAVETCNGRDDDCDGEADETFLGGAFHLGAPCDGDDNDTCAEGRFVCSPSGDGTTCDDDSGDAVEMCNGIDDDCDGMTDETWTAQGGGSGPFLGESCDGTNDADSCARGVIECDVDFDGVVCHEDDLAVFELCNGEDDTCDCDAPGADPATCGLLGVGVDEGFDIGASCTTSDLGVCRVPGVIACDADDNTTCVAIDPIAPRGEECNGLDDDCDGETDEPFATVCALDTRILTGPPALTAAKTATFTYDNPAASPPTSHDTYQCSLDGGPWVACDGRTVLVGVPGSALRESPLPAGAHTLIVRATSANRAIVDPTPAYWSWVIDEAVPDTIILSGPSDPTQSTSGAFVFGSPSPNPDYYSCVLDPSGGVCPAVGNGAYQVCPATFGFSGLADGVHTICVYVTDTKGTPDPVPASWTWTIDTTAPETAIVAPLPPTVTASTSVTFDYVDPTAPATNTFECRLDGSAWFDCDGRTDTYDDLAEGQHYFEVRTVDPNGVVDPTPATYVWIVDLTAPCPTIALHPSDPAQDSMAVFGLTASEPDVSFRCALDPSRLERDGTPHLSAYTPCEATLRYTDLEDGRHTLWVYAVDAVGNLGSCRASWSWTIDTTPPETAISAGPTPLVGRGEGVVLDYFDPGNEDAITFECKLDGAATWTRCDGLVVGEGGSIAYDALAVGPHTFAVRTCDFTKAPPVQCDPTPATWTWEVTVSPCPNDKTAPAITCAPDLELECAGGGATVDLVGLTATASDACQPVAVTTSADDSVGVGQTPLVYVATDPNGNMASCVTVVEVLDTTAPRITCPADILDATTDAGACTAAVDIGAARGVDACQGESGLLFVADAPKSFGTGETEVTHHVIDAFGNEATCVQKVVVRDDEPLVLTCSESAVVDAAPDACAWTGSRSALATDNCAGELEVVVDGTYPVGQSPVRFTASDDAGNRGECTTMLTVRDVTSPEVACGTAIGLMPTVIRATASDARGATVTIENVACTRVVDDVATPVPLERCPITVTGDTIEVTGRLTDGTLELTYDARAVDPSDNAAVVACTATYDPDFDADGVIDAEDNCAVTDNGDQLDVDEDGIGDLCDVCPAVADPDQADRDGDGVGDACSDKDRDEVLDIDDNCELDPNTDQLDLDRDQRGDVCDPLPYDGLTAEGGGSCSGGLGGLAIGLVGLAGLLATRRRARRSGD